MTHQSNILVIGGTGKTGRRVVDRLNRHNVSVRIGGRKQAPSFNWDDHDSFAPALKGIDRAYIVYYPDLAVPGAFESITALVEAMKEAKLKKVVLLSGKGEVEAERCEQVIANSGLNYSLVRASWFNQNFSESFFLDPILTGYVALPMPHAKIPFVDADDIADVVVEALLNDEHNGKTFEVTGPRKLTLEEVVSEIANATGRDIKYEAVSLEAYGKMLEAAGVPASYVWLFNYLFREVLGNDENQTISNDVEMLFGRKAKDFSEFAKEAALSGVWNNPVSI